MDYFCYRRKFFFPILQNIFFCKDSDKNDAYNLIPANYKKVVYLTVKHINLRGQEVKEAVSIVFVVCIF